MEYLVKAPGKLILIGEYAVLEGAPALVMAVNRYARVTLRPRPGKVFILHSPALEISDLKFTVDPAGDILYQKTLTAAVATQLAFFSETLRFLLKRQSDFNPKTSQTIILDTTDFFLKDSRDKFGLGSSAALTVALLKGFLVSSNISSPSGEQFFRWAQAIHFGVQGKSGSGLDIAASTHGGILAFQKAAESYRIEQLSLPPDLIILPVWSGRSASTTEMIKKVQQLKLRQPEKYWKIFGQLQRISQGAIQAVKEKETPAFLGAVEDYFNTLKKLDRATGAAIISKAHQEIAELASSQGAIYKPSGAGGGDLGLIMTHSRGIARRVAANISRSDYQILNLAVSKKGVTVLRRKNV